MRSINSDFSVINASPTFVDRFWAKVEKTDTCWIWRGTKLRRGSGSYGQIYLGPIVGYRRPMMLAHRASWELHNGPIPAGMVIDHLCRNPLCVNPAHLEAVTQAVNVRRGNAGLENSSRTHCPSGHHYDEENTHVYRGYRYCRACARARREKERARRSD